MFNKPKYPPLTLGEKLIFLIPILTILLLMAVALTFTL